MEEWQTKKIITGMHNRSLLHPEKMSHFKEIHEKYPDDEDNKEEEVVDEEKEEEEEVNNKIEHQDDVIVEDDDDEDNDISESEVQIINNERKIPEEEDDDDIKIHSPALIPPAIDYHIPPLSLPPPSSSRNSNKDFDFEQKSQQSSSVFTEPKSDHRSIRSMRSSSTSSTMSGKSQRSSKNDIMSLLQNLAKEKMEQKEQEIEAVVAKDEEKEKSHVPPIESQSTSKNKSDNDIDNWMTEDRICKIRRRCEALVEKLHKDEHYLSHNMRNCLHDEGKWIAMENHLLSLDEEETSGEKTYSYMERGSQVLEKLIGWININGINADGLTNHFKSIYPTKFDPIARKADPDKNKKKQQNSTFRFTDDNAPKEYVLADQAFWEFIDYVFLHSNPTQIFENFTNSSSSTSSSSYPKKTSSIFQNGKIPKPPSYQARNMKRQTTKRTKSSKKSHHNEPTSINLSDHDQQQMMKMFQLMKLMEQQQQQTLSSISVPNSKPETPVAVVVDDNDDGLPDGFE